MKNNQDLSFDHLDHVLARAAATADASDSHGFLVGLACTAGVADTQLWEQQLLADQESAAAGLAKALLKTHFRDIQSSLNSPDLDFKLLLPDDEEAIAWRTSMLGQWCLGFLSGLGVGGLPDTDNLSEEVNEIIGDLTDISRVDFEVENPTEDDEAALQEIIEFVRVGVLFVHEELQPVKPAPAQLQ